MRISTRKRSLASVACPTGLLLMLIYYHSGTQLQGATVQPASNGALIERRAGTEVQQVSCSQMLHRQDDSSLTVQDPNKGEILKRETITKPPFQISLHTEAYDRVRWSIMKYGKYYETGLTEHFHQILAGRSSTLVVDVGLNIGWFSLWALALGHNVYAFEPNAANILRACQSVDLNQFETDRIRIYRLGLGDVEGEMKLSWMGPNPGSAQVQTSDSFDEDQSKRPAEKRTIRSQNVQNVRVMKLDDFAETQGWFVSKQKISILKVDVEGYEPHVFNGAKHLLLSGQVENLLMEFASDKTRQKEAQQAHRETAETMLNQILLGGFELHHISNGMGKHIEGALEQVSSAVKSRDAKALVSELFAVCPTQGRRKDCQMNLWWKQN